MVEVGRSLWRSPCPNPLLKQGHLKQWSKTVSRQLLNIPKHGHSTTTLGNLVQCSAIITVKKRFLVFRRNLLHFSLCPLLLVLHWVPLKDPASILFTSSHQVLIYINQIPEPSLSRLKSPRSFSLSYVSFSIPFINFVARRWMLSSMSMSLL